MDHLSYPLIPSLVFILRQLSFSFNTWLTLSSLSPHNLNMIYFSTLSHSSSSSSSTSSSTGGGGGGGIGGIGGDCSKHWCDNLGFTNPLFEI